MALRILLAQKACIARGIYLLFSQACLTQRGNRIIELRYAACATADDPRNNALLDITPANAEMTALKTFMSPEGSTARSLCSMACLT